MVQSGSPETGLRRAEAFWLAAPGRGEVRAETLPEPGPGEVLVRTLYSAISRGTESLVFAGRVPPDQQVAMRAPFQDGEFPAPVKYGYLNVGIVVAGVAELVGRRVFCLYPHQSAYVVPAAHVHPVPDGVPDRRAVLAGTVETAVNALWDAAPRLGDRACVVGAGMVGCCVARLLARIPGVTVTLVDVAKERADVAARLGVGFALPDEVAGDHEIVVHTSGTAAGLQRCLDLLGPEGEVLELSWYGTNQVHLELGGSFHARRLAIRASQVGTVAPSRSLTRTFADRLRLSLQLLEDPVFDVLLDSECDFRDLPTTLPEIVAGHGLCHLIRYDDVPAERPRGADVQGDLP